MADMLGSILSGATSGAGKGASVGSVIPGVGTAAGAIGGAIIGGVSSGMKQNQANNSQNIPLVDPLERARLASLEQIRKSISSGTDAMSKAGIQQQQNIGRSAQNAINKSTGGDVGSTVDALLKSQKSTQLGVNQLLAGNQNRLPYFDNAVSQMSSKIAQRKLELGLLNRSQILAENAQSRTDNNVSANALLATQGGTQTIAEGVGQVIPQLKDLITPNSNTDMANLSLPTKPAQQIQNIPAPTLADQLIPNTSTSPMNNFQVSPTIPIMPFN